MGALKEAATPTEVAASSSLETALPMPLPPAPWAPWLLATLLAKNCGLMTSEAVVDLIIVSRNGINKINHRNSK